MTNYTSEIVVGSTIIAVLGVAAYMVVQPLATLTQQQRASAIYAKAWGKQWPQSKDTIYKNEISDETGPVGDDDEIYGLADKLVIPSQFNYRFFKEIRGLKIALGADRGTTVDDILVVREEYETLRQALEHDLNYKRSIVVTGHPGIGNSTFLFYLLLHRLERKLPTAVQFDPRHYFIFDKRGAKVNSLSDRDPRLEECWALSDSNNQIHQPCAAFQSLAKRVILASSPKPEKWKEWLKQAKGRCIVSDLPSVPEIAAVAKEQRKVGEQLGEQLLYDPSSTLSLVCKWGPLTRNIIRSMECAAGGYVGPIAVDAQTAAIEICNHPSTIFQHSLGIRMPQSTVSSVIFLRRRPDGKVDQGQTFIPTRHLLTIFEEQRGQKTNKEALELLFLLSSHSYTRSTAGWVHEKSMHSYLVTPEKTLVLFRGSDRKEMRSSSRLLAGTLAGLKKADVKDSFYWVPSAANFPGVDGVLGDKDGNVFTIQATIADEHTSPEEGIKKVWAQFRPEVRTKCTWHYVIIADSKEAAGGYVTKVSKQLHKVTLGNAHAQVQVWAGFLRS